MFNKTKLYLRIMTPRDILVKARDEADEALEAAENALSDAEQAAYDAHDALIEYDRDHYDPDVVIDPYDRIA